MNHQDIPRYLIARYGAHGYATLTEDHTHTGDIVLLSEVIARYELVLKALDASEKSDKENSNP